LKARFSTPTRNAESSLREARGILCCCARWYQNASPRQRLAA
jgi:hypothetical protein